MITNISLRTIPDLLAMRYASSPEATAFFTLDQEKYWQGISWKQFKQNVSFVTAFLITAGIGKGDCVGILAPTSLNWEYAQMGALAASILVAGIDHNNPPDQLNHIFSTLNLSVLFVQDHATFTKIPVKHREKIKQVIVFEGNPQHPHENSISEILLAAKALTPEDSINYATPEPEDAAIMVFTSGTTDFPKAIIFTHEQVLAAVNAILGAFDDIEEGTILLCWLPLANLFQRVINFCAISIGASSYILNDPRDLMNYVDQVNPHILIGIPRVYERIHTGIMDQIQKRMWVIRNTIYWALHIGYQNIHKTNYSTTSGFLNNFLWKFADKLILQHLRGIFGSKIRYFISGSAAIPIWLLEWYEAIGIPVLEAYGVSENIIPNAINRLSSRKIGTVGQPLIPNQIILASDGEILVRGPGIFQGYWGNIPEQGKERFTSNGYLCTGDLGQIDDEGFLSLVGRKSDIFKTSNGKWIVPTRIEAQLLHVPYIKQCIVFSLGSGRIAAIACIDRSRFLSNGNSLPKKESSTEIVSQDIDISKLREDLRSAFQILPIHERPIGVIITTKHFLVSNGELTTNLKLRRKAIIDNFAHFIKQLEVEITKATEADNNALPGKIIFLSPVILTI